MQDKQNRCRTNTTDAEQTQQMQNKHNTCRTNKTDGQTIFSHFGELKIYLRNCGIMILFWRIYRSGLFTKLNISIAYSIHVQLSQPPIIFATDHSCHPSQLPPITFATHHSCHPSQLQPIPVAAHPSCRPSQLPPITVAAHPSCHPSQLLPITFAVYFTP